MAEEIGKVRRICRMIIDTCLRTRRHVSKSVPPLSRALCPPYFKRDFFEAGASFMGQICCKTDDAIVSPLIPYGSVFKTSIKAAKILVESKTDSVVKATFKNIP
eukprot:805383-Amorphochlora_amoeboformis.AAC.1